MMMASPVIHQRIQRYKLCSIKSAMIPLKAWTELLLLAHHEQLHRRSYRSCHRRKYDIDYHFSYPKLSKRYRDHHQRAVFISRISNIYCNDKTRTKQDIVGYDDDSEDGEINDDEPEDSNINGKESKIQLCLRKRFYTCSKTRVFLLDELYSRKESDGGEMGH